MRYAFLPLAIVLLAGSSAPAASEAIVAGAGAARAAARSVPAGGELVLTDVRDIFSGEALTLELERFEVLAPGAKLIVHDVAGELSEELPRSVHFRGWIAGRPEARVALALHEDGELRGLAVAPGEVRMLGFASPAARAAGRLEARLALASEVAQREKTFTCANPEDPGLARSRALFAESAATTPWTRLPKEASVAGHRVVYAVETDFELYDLFDDRALAAEYITDLMAFVSSLYATEINTDLLVGQVSLYNSAGDPWGQTSTLCSLFEFGRYWNDNRSGVERDAAVMLSGKNNGGGVAWLGVLCSGGFDYNRGSCSGLTPAVDNYGGAYAYVGTMDGNFDLANPQIVWDLLATAHEIGHNFDSPHSHCYGGILGDANPIDGCYAGANECGPTCYCTEPPPATPPPAGVPGVGTLIGGTPGSGNGTIMGYCHLLSPGNANVALSFGTGHTYGIAASREAAHMTNYVNSLGSCVSDQAGAGIFADGFEGGSFARWVGSQP